MDSDNKDALRKKYKSGIPTKCHRCGYPWLYTGSDQKRETIYTNEYPVYAICPQCRTSVRIKIPEYFPEVTVRFEDIPSHEPRVIETFDAPEWTDAIDRLIIKEVKGASRKGVTLTPDEIWHAIGTALIPCDEVVARLERLVDAGILEKEACGDFEGYWADEEKG